jgi:hypothetical protein
MRNFVLESKVSWSDPNPINPADVLDIRVK